MEVLHKRTLYTQRIRFRRRVALAKDLSLRTAYEGYGGGGERGWWIDCAMVIKWYDAYPIESFRLKNMAVHPIQLPPPTSATSVDASFGKWNNINVINDGKLQLIDQLSDRLPRLIHIEQRDEISLYYITQTLIQLQFNLK